MKPIRYQWTFTIFGSCVALITVALITHTAAAQMIDLAGDWNVRFDPDDQGRSEQWFAPSLGDHTIQLPGTTDLAGIGHPLDKESMTYDVPVLLSGFTYSQDAKRLDETGYLVRDHLFIGKVWYQRAIKIPASWKNQRVELLLERINWQSTVWINDKPIGSCDSLAAAHRYDLGVLPPGEHRLTICVDNDMVHDIGVLSHAYGPETQSRWNGIVGRIELRATEQTWIDNIQVFPAEDGKTVAVRVKCGNLAAVTKSDKINFSIRQDNETLGSASESIVIEANGSTSEFTIKLEKPADFWDEFHPNLCQLDSSLSSSQSSVNRVRFGFRTIRREGRHVLLNGRRIQLRGTLDCCVYPKTGHPPVTRTEWLGVLSTIKQYGFNHVRFHTWCPPEPAFDAADELGIFLQPETAAWVDDWTAQTNPRPKPIGRDPQVTNFLRREIERIHEAYGNHPSFALFCIGNEFGNSQTDWQVVNELIEEVKQNDSRRLYAGSTARKLGIADDFWVTHHTGHSTRGVGPSNTNWNFDQAANATTVPVIAHETGQRPVFPHYQDLLPKFNGPLKPYNLVRLRNELNKNGLGEQNESFTRASALFQNVQYKAEHEAFHRTAEYAGYQLLMLNDFTGQSEALVGILDPFWQSKGVVTAEQVRQWNAPTVLLAMFDHFTWTSNQTFAAELAVSHYGDHPLVDQTLSWELVSQQGDRILSAGEMGSVSIDCGTLSTIGNIEVELVDVTQPTQAYLRVRMNGTSNEWPLWIYPQTIKNQTKLETLVAEELDDEALDLLRRGGRVLLLAHSAKGDRTAPSPNGFTSVYWSAGWWGNTFSQLGVCCDPNHPALSGFPNAGHSDWQWSELTSQSTTFDLTGLFPADYRPIVQPVTDFHRNRLLGHVFELQVDKGSLVVCGYDLSKTSADRPAATAFLNSLLSYMESIHFSPHVTITLEQLRQLVPEARPSQLKQPGTTIR